MLGGVSTVQRYSEAMSVVLLGAFNPAIFHPSWFVAEELLPPLDDGGFTLHVAHQQVTAFDAGWLSLHADATRLDASTEDPSAFDALRDLVLGTVRLLRHTPVRAVGVNTGAHYRLSDTAAWEELLTRYAPLSSWQSMLSEPQLGTLSVVAGRPDAIPGALRITIEPSSRVDPGAYVHLNDHFEHGQEASEGPPSADFAIEVLTKHWADAQQRGRELTEAVVSRT